MRRLVCAAALVIVGCGSPAAEETVTSDETEAEGEALMSFSSFQEHNLHVVNAYRARKHLALLTLAPKITTFAKAGSKELSIDHQPHQHFIHAIGNGTLWTSGFAHSAGENQGDPHGWPVLSPDAATNKTMQIDAIEKMMFDEGPGTGEAHGHYENMMNPKFRRIGIGFLTVIGHLYLTNDFSE